MSKNYKAFYGLKMAKNSLTIYAPKNTKLGAVVLMALRVEDH